MVMRRFWKWVSKRAAKYAGLPLRDPALKAMLGEEPAASGIDVTEDTALNCSAVFAAVRLISQSIASLPLGVVQKSGMVRKPLPKHPYNRLFEFPNPEMIPFVFFETLAAHTLTWGNAYAWIDRKDGVPVALWPLMPNQIQPARDEDGAMYYQFAGRYPGEADEAITAADVIHIVGLGFDGLKGYSVVSRAREAIGLALATENFGASFFGRGATPGGVLKYPGELSDEAKANLRKSWERMHRGPENSHRVAILEEGMDYSSIGMNNDDAEFLETRKFQVVEIARWFNVPPHMIRDLSQSTLDNIEKQGLEFLTYTLGPWLLKWQQELRRKLFTEEEQRAGLLVDHDVSALIKMDTAARYQSYREGLSGGWLTLNDILSKENLPPVESTLGAARAIPENMRLFDTDGDEIQRTKAEDESKGSAVAVQVLTAVSAGQITPEAAGFLLSEVFQDMPPERVAAIIGKASPVAGATGTGASQPVSAAPLAAAETLGVDSAQDTALNGAQIASLLTVLQSVAAGQLAPESAKELIVVSFPTVDVAKVDAMLAPYQNVPQQAPPVAPDHEGRALRVPDVHQTDDSSCGLACLRSVLGFYGVEEQEGATHPEGLKPAEIAELARAHGLNVLAGPMGLPGLRRQLGMGRPVICPIQVGNPDGTSAGHYVVVRGFAGQSVQLQDPAYGPVIMARDAFLDRWHDVDRDGEEYRQYGIAVWR